MFIRRYVDGDEDAVIAIWNECLPTSAPHNQPLITIQKKLAVNRDLFFVAECEGSVVGTTMAGYDGHRGWIYCVAVVPSHQEKGIGAALVKHAESALIDCGCLKVNLQVLGTNTQVVSFYKRLGYIVEERVSMSKRLY